MLVLVTGSAQWLPPNTGRMQYEYFTDGEGHSRGMYRKQLL
jgi:hypothetical protein